MPLTPAVTPFLEKHVETGDSDYFIFGVPLEKTSSNRRGARFGPAAIRRESVYLDSFSQRTGLDWDDLSLSDIGDVECEEIESCLTNIEDLISATDSTPFMLGGEHLVTYGALRAIKPDLVIVYDAHLDLRDQLFGAKMSHATYLRRGYEELGFEAIVIGARALSHEEVSYVKQEKSLRYITSLDLMKGRVDAVSVINEMLESSSKAYLSIDLDVLDPSYAPAVGNPYPEGLSTTQLMDLISATMNAKINGFDLSELCPHFDTGNTATVAAYIVLETLYSHVWRKRDVR